MPADGILATVTTFGISARPAGSATVTRYIKFAGMRKGVSLTSFAVHYSGYGPSLPTCAAQHFVCKRG